MMPCYPSARLEETELKQRCRFNESLVTASTVRCTRGLQVCARFFLADVRALALEGSAAEQLTEPQGTSVGTGAGAASVTAASTAKRPTRYERVFILLKGAARLVSGEGER